VSGWCKRCCTGIGKLLHSSQRYVTTAVTAPFVCEGAMNGETFKAYVEQFLAPTLRRGDIVFMDNVSVHKVDGVEEAIEARGAIPFYLPPYSPDFNPIEQLFAKFKAMLRKIAAYSLKNSAFTINSLCKAIASCLRDISRSECAAFLAHSGYGQPIRDTL
jgi:transposase